MEKTNLINSLTIQLADSSKLPITELQKIITAVLADYSVTKINSNLPSTGDGSATLYIFQKFAQCKFNQGMNKNSLEQYKIVLNQFFDFVQKEITVCDDQDVSNFITYLKQKNLKSQTIKNKYRILSSIFGFMYDYHYIADNPMKKISSPKMTQEFEEPVTKDEEERIKLVCEKFKSNKSAKSLAIFNFLLDSGVRVTEMCNINLTDVNFTQREVHVRNGKGGKDRIVYFTEKTAVRIQEYLRTRNDIENGISINPDTPLFATVHNKKMSKVCVEKLMKEIGNAAGVSRLHPHLLRATFATRLVEKGVPLNIVAEMLGHANLHTIDRYVRISKQNKKYYYNMAS